MWRRWVSEAVRSKRICLLLNGLWAPKATPKEVIAALNAAISACITLHGGRGLGSTLRLAGTLSESRSTILDRLTACGISMVNRPNLC